MAKIAKIENKSEEQQPSTPLGGLRGWLRGPRPPLFLWNFLFFHKILWNIKSIYIADKYPGHPFLNFLAPSLHPLLHPRDPLLTLSKRTWSKFIRLIFVINRLSVFWKDRALIISYPTSASGIIVLLKTPTKSRWISPSRTNRKRQGTSAIHMSHVYQNCQRANGLAWTAWMKNQNIIAMNISFLENSSGF